mmetsp:Transcript_706/g.1104  ORF Transcript_706/g.1104 Transcript_706/m.1104 type:complete len:117 (+) Transcript_706:28-378(+)
MILHAVLAFTACFEFIQLHAVYKRFSYDRTDLHFFAFILFTLIFVRFALVLDMYNRSLYIVGLLIHALEVPMFVVIPYLNKKKPVKFNSETLSKWAFIIGTPLLFVYYYPVYAIAS